MTTNTDRRQAALRALAAAYPSVVARGDEPTAALAGDLLSDLLHLIRAEALGTDAERIDQAEQVHARAWRNFTAELHEASRAGASEDGASQAPAVRGPDVQDALAEIGIQLESPEAYAALAARLAGAPPVKVTGGGELLRLLTETGLRDFLDGYTSKDDGVIQADPATVAGEAAAAGLVATLGMSGWAVADPYSDEYLSDGYESPAEALLAADARLAMDRAARPLDSDDREDVTDAERDAGTLLTSDAPRGDRPGWYDRPDDVTATVFDPADETFGPILAAIQGGEFGEAAARLNSLDLRTRIARDETRPDPGPLCADCGAVIEEGQTLCDSCDQQRRHEAVSESDDGETVHGIPRDTAEALLRMANLKRDGEGRYGGTFWDRGEALRDALILIAIAGTPAADAEPLSLDTMGEEELRDLAKRLLPFAPVGWAA